MKHKYKVGDKVSIAAGEIIEIDRFDDERYLVSGKDYTHWFRAAALTGRVTDKK